MPEIFKISVREMRRNLISPTEHKIPFFPLIYFCSLLVFSFAQIKKYYVLCIKTKTIKFHITAINEMVKPKIVKT